MAVPGLQAQGIPGPPSPQAQAQAGQQQEQHAQPAQEGQQIIHLNWFRIKPEFSGKPAENAEAHLLHTNDWMNAHNFVEGAKSKDVV